MDQRAVFTKMALNAWQVQVDRSSRLISELSDEQLLKEIAPGKNRGVYVIGHLVAIHDAISEILGSGKRSYPALQGVFVDVPDRAIQQIPPVSELRQMWTSINARLKNEFALMSPESWFTRHESMTDADFEKDPARNKLSVLLNRTSHLAYHFGQIRLLK